jgi:tetratricopeptide (TPR) repeat protein
MAQLAVNEALAEKMDNLAISGLVDLGNSYLSVFNTREAEPHLRRALDLAQRAKIRRGEVRAKAALISFFEQEHEPEKAKALAPEVVPFYRQAGYSRELAQVAGILAGVHAQLGEYEEGIRFSRDALAGVLRLQDKTNEARIRARLGLNLSGAGLWPEALKEYLIIAKDPDSGVQGRLSRLSCARLYWWLGRSEDAARFIRETEQELAKAPDSQVLFVMQTRKVEMAYDEKRWSDVLDLTRQALSAKEREEEAEHSLLLFEALALIRSGREARGGQRAADLLNTLERDKLVGSLAASRIRMAEAWVAVGKRTIALELVLKALQFIEQRQIFESVWRAHAVAAQAQANSADSNGHREKARLALEQLKMRWSAESIGSYLSRPVIQHLSKEARL